MLYKLLRLLDVNVSVQSRKTAMNAIVQKSTQKTMSRGLWEMGITVLAVVMIFKCVDRPNLSVMGRHVRRELIKIELFARKSWCRPNDRHCFQDLSTLSSRIFIKTQTCSTELHPLISKHE